MIIKGGKAFIDNAFLDRDIRILDGKIAEVGDNLSGDEMIDAKGMLVTPGLIDPHVHLREPGATSKEDFYTGSRAAVAGGFTTVIDMPNNPMPTVTKERLDEKKELSKKAICNVLFHFGATATNYSDVRAADPDSLKIYLGKTTGNMLIDESFAKRHFEEFPRDRPIVLHACSDLEDEEKNLEETYRIQEQVYRAANGRRLHIAHASTKKEITMAKQHPNITVEVAPHHLLLSTRDFERLGRMKNVFPTLKSPQKQLMLQSAMELADCIATDHAPHTVEDKEAGAAGFPGLETSLAAMLDLCNRGIADRHWVISRMTSKVAEIFNLKGKGRLKEGYDADITIIDPNKEWKVDGGLFETKCKWSPFEGFRFKGKAKTVIKEGKIIFDNFSF